MKRNVSVMMAIIFLLVPALVLGMGASVGYRPSAAVFDGNLLAETDNFIASNFPGRETLTRWSLAVRVLGGQREYNQIFISGDELIPFLDPPLDYQVRDNTQAILQFAERAQVPIYCMIIPTVSAIRQQSLPAFFLGQSVNQKQFIEDIYAQLLGQVTVIDAYSALFNAQEQYIFYRTENNLTALGGFHLYYALGGRGRLLEGIARPSFRDYDIEHVKHDFLGDLYAQSPFQGARADTLSIFRYRRVPREYTVTKRHNGLFKTYHTIFPLHKLELEGNNAMDIYLGGMSAVTTITSSTPYSNHLLVLGDRTALAFVPFLVNHYRTVTLIDLSQMGREDFRLISDAIRDNAYDQILFAYSIETFMHRPFPAWSVALLPEHDEYERN